MTKKDIFTKEITFDDLVKGTGIEIKDDTKQTYEVFKEDLDNFKQCKRVKREKTDFFTAIPETEETLHIQNILKRKEHGSKMLKKKLQAEFEKKMRRLRKIKSKTHKKNLKKALKEIDADIYNELNLSESEEVEEIENEDVKLKPFLEIEPDEFVEEALDVKRENVDLLNEAFEEESDEEFKKEKVKILTEDAPAVKETVLPGFDGNWAGEGIEIVKTKFNVVKEYKEGINVYERVDYGKSNLIVNENVKYSEKYKSKVPFGYTAEMFNQKIKMNLKKPQKIKQKVGRELEDKIYKEDGN